MIRRLISFSNNSRCGLAGPMTIRPSSPGTSTCLSAWTAFKRNVIRVCPTQGHQDPSGNWRDFTLPALPASKLTAQQNIASPQQQRRRRFTVDIKGGICRNILVQDQIGAIMIGMAVIVEPEEFITGRFDASLDSPR